MSIALPQCRWRTRATLLLLTLAVVACGRGRGARPESGATPQASGDEARTIAGGMELYRQAGLIVEATPIPVVGNLHFLASPTPDSTLVLLALSLSNSGLTFVREGDRFRAAYEVTADFSRGGERVRRIETRQHVRVGSFRETTRTDESVIYQEFAVIPPGNYDVRLTVRDVEGSQRSTIAADVSIPRLEEGALSTPVPVHESAHRVRGDSVPRLIASPRATAIFGRDSAIPMYLEAYGGGSDVPVALVARHGDGITVWTDSVRLERRGTLFSGTISVPVSPLGIGTATVLAARLDVPDTVQTPVFVGFGADLPLVSFSEMLDFLEYFASPQRLRALREAPPEQRAAVWADFLRETDPVLSTSEHEALRDYFGRIRLANFRFRDEGVPGWRTDRGRVFISLGEPDQILEENRSDFSRRGRVQLWEYREHRVRLVFIDQSGFGRWTMTPNSETEFRAILRRVQNR